MDFTRVNVTGDAQIAYSEFGRRGGRPLFFFHGYPGSRLQATLMDGIADELGIHIVAPDRPGVGRSSYVPSRQILDWPATIVTLADHLGWDRFSLIGVSGGGPYAQACALKIPERMAKGVIVAGAPYYQWIRNGTTVRPDLKRVFTVMSRRPGRARFFLGLARIVVRMSPGTSLLRTGLAGIQEPDRSAVSPPDRLKAITATTREAFRGPAAGLALDLKLLTSDWGFTLADITTSLRFWHGDKDLVCPLPELRTALGGSTLHTVTVAANEGHYSLPINRAREILTSAV